MRDQGYKKDTAVSTIHQSNFQTLAFSILLNSCPYIRTMASQQSSVDIESILIDKIPSIKSPKQGPSTVHHIVETHRPLSFKNVPKSAPFQAWLASNKSRVGDSQIPLDTISTLADQNLPGRSDQNQSLSFDSSPELGKSKTKVEPFCQDSFSSVESESLQPGNSSPTPSNPHQPPNTDDRIKPTAKFWFRFISTLKQISPGSQLGPGESSPTPNDHVSITIEEDNDEVYNREIYYEAMRPLEMILGLGYYIMLIPFHIVSDGEGLKMKSNCWHLGMSFFLLFLGIFMQLNQAWSKLRVVKLISDPSTLFPATDACMTVIFSISFTYMVIAKRNRFYKLFTTFSSGSSSRPTSKWKLWAFIGIPMAFYLGVGNWTVWGQASVDFPSLDFLELFAKKGYQYLHLPKPKEDDERSLYVTIVGISTLILEVHSTLMVYYILFLLWSASVTLYRVVDRTRKICLVKDEDGKFDMQKRTNAFRTLSQFANKLSLAIGPIVVVFYIQVIPFCVSKFCGFLYEKEENGNSTAAIVIEALLLPLKIGHMYFGAEACGNAENIVEEVLKNRVERNPEEREDMSTIEKVYQQNKTRGRISEFRDVARRSITIQGLDFFDVDYRLLGGMLVTCITFLLLIVEWKMGSSNTSNPTTITLQYNATHITLLSV